MPEEMTDGVFNFKKVDGFDIYTAEDYYYDFQFKATELRELAFAKMSKSNGITKYYVRYGTKLQDREDRPKERFLEVDEEVWGLYKGYLTTGEYAGYTMANRLIAERGYNNG
jgi:hypothetical protein